MKPEKLPSGSYRVRKMINGQNISKVFDHKPSQKEIAIALAADIDNVAPKMAFKNCATKYIKSKDQVLSPTTVKSYYSFIEKVLPDWFLNMKVSEIEGIHIQRLINDYAVDHKDKTVRNLHGFVSAVMGMFRPNMVIRTTLPPKRRNEPYVPSTDEIKAILDASIGTKYHIPFQLGVLGMRRGEICALTLDDIDDNIIMINKALVTDRQNNWFIKPTPKTDAGNRDIYIPDALKKEILNAGTIYDGYPNQLLKNLHSFQDKLNIPSFRFHDLRHFFASYAHSMGMSDADIMKSGGWKSDHVMKNVYRHAMKDTLHENQAKIANGIL